MIIYMATNILNGDFYIGLTTKDISSPMGRHLGRSKNPKQYFHHAISHYGFDNFKWEVIDNDGTSSEHLKALEVWYIAELKPKYNMTEGGDGVRGYDFTDQHKKNISKANKGKPSKYKGIPRSQEIKDKISKSNSGVSRGKGIPRSQEVKNKISKKLIGHKMPQETKDKISQTLKNRKEECKQS